MLRIPGLASLKSPPADRNVRKLKIFAVLGCSFGGGRHEASDLGRIQNRFDVQNMLVQHTFVITKVIGSFRKRVTVTDLIC